MTALLTVALFAVAQSPDADAKAAIALAQSQAPKPPQAPPVAVSPPKATRTYADYRADAIAQGKPIVIFVRCEPRPIVGAVTVRVDHLAGYDSGPNIVIGVPDASVGMKWKATLERDASDAAIRRELQVSRQAIPFFQRLKDRKDERRTADDSSISGGLPDWFPSNAVRYSPARWTQVAYKTATATTPHNTVHAFDDGGRIDRWPVSLLDTKWQSPGGLEFARGWESERYKYLPVPPTEGIATVTLANGVLVGDDKSGEQVERIITRKYADGTWFADVLRNDAGDIFEIRFAEKDNGAWRRFVAFRNAAAQPKGYSPVREDSCHRCHDLAGQGSYASARIPGADGVFSDPFQSLEK